MDITTKSVIALDARHDLKPLSLLTIGVIISALLVLNGFIFRTYTIAMSSPSWEAARQFGLPYVFAEIGVILYALRRGLDLRDVWNIFPCFLQYCIIFFATIFWIGGVFRSPIAPLATAQNLIFLIHPIFAIAIYHSISRLDLLEMRRFVVALAIGLLIFCAMTAYAFLNHPPIATMPNDEIVWQFIIPGFISVRLFGAFCGALFCFFFAQLLLDEEAHHRRNLPYVWLTLCAAMTIWSGTRNAVLGIAVAMAAMVIVYRLRPLNLKSLTLLFLSATAAAWFATCLIPYNDPAFMLIASGDEVTTESMSGGRASYWTAIWNAYQTVPLFGAGPFASFWIFPVEEARHVQPHNIILQFLITWGLPATIAALVVLTYTTWKAHLVGFKHRIVLPFLAMLDCLLVMALFDGMAHFAQPLMLMMISFGVIFSVTKTGHDQLIV
jgi:exopolysaccharide production protein ExoQ